MNGSQVIGRTASTIFVRLPDDAQRPCGTCSCSYCKANPERTPMWDTLAIATSKPADGPDTVWTVHMPDAGSIRRAIDAGYVQGPHATVVMGGRKKVG